MLIIDEGDPFNKILFGKSISDMKSENLFKSVNYNVKDDKNIKKEILKLRKSNGEIFAGAERYNGPLQLV